MKSLERDLTGFPDMRYKCLIIDHDDTVVDSTSQINYPAFMAALKILRPEIDYCFDEFMKLNFDIGFFNLMRDVLHFSDEEVAFQEEIWRQYMECKIPTFYEHMPDVLRRFKQEGGKICVSSHSSKEYIIRDYVANCGIIPDMVFDCNLPKEKIKPSPYAIDESKKKYSLLSEEILVLDDLPSGLKMAKEGNADFAYAGWGYYNAEMIDYMCKNAKYICTDVAELAMILF